MEDLPRNLSKNVKRLSEPRTARRSTRWTLLLVDETGRTIRVRGFRFLVALGLFIVLGLAAAGGAAFYLLKMEQTETERLRAALAGSAGAPAKEPAPAAVRPATDEAEPGSADADETPAAPGGPAEIFSAPPDDPAVESLENSAADSNAAAEGQDGLAPSESPAGELPAVPPERVFSSAPADAPEAAEAPSGPPRVAVEQVAFPEEDRYAVAFRLANVAPGAEKVAGHVVVVLRLANGGYAAIPEVPLVKGRPTGKVEGESFSIQNYRPMRFRAGPEVDGDRVRGAAAFVFDSGGRLLLETPLNAEPE
jgi:hypothetical protein